MSRIKQVSAIEILDSRGRPTLLANCELTDGSVGRASVPSGASTGSAEALELRDKDPTRYAGLGCLKAAKNVSQHINRAIAGEMFASQELLDRFLIDLDGTVDKSRLGANAILSVSLAFALAQAAQREVALYRHFADIAGTAPRLPKPMINLYSGGKHAGGQVAIQDVQVVVPSATSMRETLAVVSDVFRAAARRLLDKYDMRLLTADEGGLAPPLLLHKRCLSRPWRRSRQPATRHPKMSLSPLTWPRHTSLKMDVTFWTASFWPLRLWRNDSSSGAAISHCQRRRRHGRSRLGWLAYAL